MGEVALKVVSGTEAGKGGVLTLLKRETDLRDSGGLCPTKFLKALKMCRYPKGLIAV